MAQKSDASDTRIELNNDELAAVAAYFECNMNQTRAYMMLHPKTPYDSARSLGSSLFAKVNIKSEIKRRLDEKAMSAEEAIARLGDIARADVYPFIRIDEDGFVYFNFSDPQAMAYLFLIKKIKTKRERRLEGGGQDAEEWEGEWVEVELHDAHAAIRDILKIHGRLDNPKQASVNVSPAPFSIPAELIAPDLLSVYRDVRSGAHSIYNLDGGRGSVKSTNVADIIIMLLINNPEGHFLALRTTAENLRKSVYQQLIWSVNSLGLTEKFKFTTSPMEATYLPTGQKIFMQGGDEPGKLKSIKVPFGYIIGLWWEEFDQFRGMEQVRNIVQSALRGGDKAWQFRTWNTPKQIKHWVNQYLLASKSDSRCFNHHSNYLNVPIEWLGKPFIEEAEFLKETNYEAYEHEYLGVSNGIGGLVFPNVEQRTITDDEIKQFDRVGQGIDWGWFPAPTAWTRSHLDLSRREIYIFDEHRFIRTPDKDIYDYLYEKEDGKKAPKDELLIADSVPGQSVGNFKSYGANIRGAQKDSGSREYSYKWLQSLAKIVIDPVRAPNSAHEFSNAEYPQDKDGNYLSDYPEENDHFIDSTRYRTNNIWLKRGQ